jgi:murein DD-endopeptidase MepM/ murein hydrolase activator NlpD
VAAALALPLAIALLPLPAPTATADDPLRTRASAADARRDAVRRELATSTEAMVQAVAALRDAESDLPTARSDVRRARAAYDSARRRELAAAAARASAQVRLVSMERVARDAAADAEAAGRRWAGWRARRTSKGPTNDWLAVLEARSPRSSAPACSSSARWPMRTGTPSRTSTRWSVSTTPVRRTSSARATTSTSAHEAVEAEVAATAEAERVATAAAQRLAAVVARRQGALKAARAALAEDAARYAELTAAANSLQAQLRARARVERAAAAAAAARARPARAAGARRRRRRLGRFRAGELRRAATSGAGSGHLAVRDAPASDHRRLQAAQRHGLRRAVRHPIRAAADGIVLSTGYHRAYGHRTVIAHGLVGGGSLATTYNHQSGIGVTAGSRSPGSVIGAVGTTATRRGVTHLEVLGGRQLREPVRWL